MGKILVTLQVEVEEVTEETAGFFEQIKEAVDEDNYLVISMRKAPEGM